MSSPFAAFTNATIQFKIPTGAITFNSVGNRVVETSDIVIKAMLNPIRDAATLNQYVGDDENSELFSGYLTDPLTLPANFHPPIEGQATIETSVGIAQTGTFKLLPSSSSAYLVGLKIDFLNKVIGVFRHG